MILDDNLFINIYNDLFIDQLIAYLLIRFAYRYYFFLYYRYHKINFSNLLYFMKILLVKNNFFFVHYLKNLNKNCMNSDSFNFNFNLIIICPLFICNFFLFP